MFDSKKEDMDSNKKYTLDRINQIISSVYYIGACIYFVIGLSVVIKARFSVSDVFFSLIVVTLLFFSGEGLRKKKGWGKPIALFTALLITFIELSEEITKGKMINPLDAWIVCIFGYLSLYLIISMIIQLSNKRKKKSVK